MVCSSFDVSFDDDKHDSKPLSLRRLGSQYERGLTARPILLGCILLCTVIFLWRGLGTTSDTAATPAPSGVLSQPEFDSSKHSYVAVHKGKHIKKDKQERRAVKAEETILKREKRVQGQEKAALKDEEKTLSKEEKLLQKEQKAFEHGDMNKVHKFQKDLDRLARIEEKDSAKVHSLAGKEHRKEDRFEKVDSRLRFVDSDKKAEKEHAKVEGKETKVIQEIASLEKKQSDMDEKQALFSQKRKQFEQQVR